MSLRKSLLHNYIQQITEKMSDSSNIVVGLLTGGLGATLGSIGTALIQTVSKKGESRATAADMVTNAAGNLADRLDRWNKELREENAQMRKAFGSLCEAVEDILEIIPDEVEKKLKVKKAVEEARIAFR